ncbi:hypothetical protein QR680_008369 [Steinernema hermaphroditum]|uniref:Uncharacterized protein n=1 Tax=Steinernema hermaphroditum TaxID=289476 RepID=A0AA39III3_9BILA|nr:hypothetical protein QR680_008369 [Steinernema hermaphroditum]
MNLALLAVSIVFFAVSSATVPTSPENSFEVEKVFWSSFSSGSDSVRAVKPQRLCGERFFDAIQEVCGNCAIMGRNRGERQRFENDTMVANSVFVALLVVFMASTALGHALKPSSELLMIKMHNEDLAQRTMCLQNLVQELMEMCSGLLDGEEVVRAFRCRKELCEERVWTKEKMMEMCA